MNTLINLKQETDCRIKIFSKQYSTISIYNCRGYFGPEKPKTRSFPKYNNCFRSLQTFILLWTHAKIRNIQCFNLSWIFKKLILGQFYGPFVQKLYFCKYNTTQFGAYMLLYLHVKNLWHQTVINPRLTLVLFPPWNCSTRFYQKNYCSLFLAWDLM